MSKPPYKSGGSKSGGFKSGGSGRGRPPGGPSRGGPSSGGSDRRGRDERAGDARRSERGPGERGRSDRAASPRSDAPARGERSFGERGRSDRNASPRSDAPARGERSFGERGRSDRAASPRGEAPARGERSFGERGRNDRSASPRSDAPARGERSFGERGRSDRSASPRSDAPARGERSFGERGRNDRSASPRGDTPARGERSFGERGRSDRTAGPRGDAPARGERSFGERGRSDHSASPRGERPDRNTRNAPAPVIRKATHAAPRAAPATPRDESLPAREGERIAKLLARAGVASRREAERLIEAGRVKLGDQVIDTPATVLPSLRGVTVDGEPVKDPEGTRLFLFHKPSGLLTAERDPAGRPTIYAALRNALPENAGRVMPVGRLDLNTEGLLLLTNDGEFKRQLELPATGVPRTYRARTFGDISQPQLEQLMEGIEVDGVIYGQINANMERRTGRNQWIEMTLTEGKNREVRRVLEALGLQVSRLIRVAYGPFLLGDLPKGMAGEISQKDLDNFRNSLPKSTRPKGAE
ncbi:pseudouridine synthase [Novosphingobium sp. Rr 2-17]|uniref:pseudouridine synthase n=1 Tax=Novosphingobium sp. Rr 2-17 TaxID=555793 RepID=UPI0005BDB175|nr:pseudouridine synthase [Novosphingobium sp. Rr 2-17]